MLAKQSIRRKFLFQLIIASASLIFVFSSFLYFYIENSIYDEKHKELIQFAKNIANDQSLLHVESDSSDSLLGIEIEIIQVKKFNPDIDLYETIKNGRTFLTLIYPYNFEDLSYLKITKEVTHTKKLLDKILRYIFIINILGFVLVILYAITLSKILIIPIKTISNRLSNMNEHLMKPIKVEELPEEFEPLGVTINHLIARIQNFVKYKKELFIGTAHELKTPLAVIKLKSQVTLMKKREPQEYIDALKTTIKSIDEMNIIVSNILNVGRQEGAQLEKPTKLDLIVFLKNKANDFKLLAESEGKIVQMDFQPSTFMATLQTSLLNQIVQNFVQNALKFTPKEKSVMIKSSKYKDGLLIEVIDEGCGIDDSVDLFAPFKRQGDKSGVGLGLFLAKSAADALGADIKIQNREDGVQGTIATLEVKSQPSCKIST
ncbi:MAG: HAMP domain-containing histidine kinase [Sulfurimonas sp.]|nr:HAMP domain-containing histidine kinase [Sulfurimonas sp.]